MDCPKICLPDADMHLVTKSQIEAKLNWMTGKCCSAAIEFDCENLGYSIQTTNNCVMSKFTIGINGEKPLYKIIRKRAGLNTWHVYAGYDLDDRICTITCSMLMNFDLYFYEKPYPKRDADTDYSHLESKIDSKDGWMKRLQICDKDSGDLLMMSNVSCCTVNTSVEPKVDFVLMMIINCIWVAIMNQ